MEGKYCARCEGSGRAVLGLWAGSVPCPECNRAPEPAEVEAIRQERDAAKKYMAAYAECDRIVTEAYRALEAETITLRQKVADMEAAWLVAHGVDLQAALAAVKAVRKEAALQTLQRLGQEWDAAQEVQP